MNLKTSARIIALRDEPSNFRSNHCHDVVRSMKAAGVEVLGQSFLPDGSIHMQLELDATQCFPMAASLYHAGLRLTQAGHEQLTVLCQLAHHLPLGRNHRVEVTIEVQSKPQEGQLAEIYLLPQTA